MASFCAKCGSALSANEQFCTSCGAAAATGGAAPAQPSAAQPGAAPASSGSSAAKIILIIVAVIVGLGILGLVGSIFTIRHYVTHNIHTGPGGQVSINTPGGTISANSSQTYTAAELGTDPYPGAQGTDGSVKMSSPSGSTVIGSFLTTDSKQQVLDFYKGKFGGSASVLDIGNGAMITQAVSKQESVQVTIMVSSAQDKDKGKTRITIMHNINTKAP
jgi:hypothetical protein